MLGDGLERDNFCFLARLLDLHHGQLKRFSQRFPIPAERILPNAPILSVIAHTFRTLCTMPYSLYALAYRWLFGFDPLNAKNKMYR
jgi:hypothetical protein